MENRTAPKPIIIRKSASMIHRASDPILDATVYWCPVRETYSFAMIDCYGEYWSAAHWHLNGAVFEQRRGVFGIGLRLNPLYEDPRSQGSLQSMINASQAYKEALNGRPEEFSAFDEVFGNLVVPYYDLGSLEEYNRPGNKAGWQTFEMSLIRDRYQTENDEDSYHHARLMWEACFDEIYPRPQGSKLASHEISTRAAKFRYKKKLSKERRKERDREASIPSDPTPI